MRVTYFDPLRSVLAWFGIFLHAALFYSASYGSYHWVLHGQQTSIYFTMFVTWIHQFRLPTFFFIAGFFSMLSLDKHGIWEFSKSRVMRILLPFLFFYGLMVFLPLYFLQHASMHSLLMLYSYGFLYQLLIMTVLLIALYPFFRSEKYEVLIQLLTTTRGWLLLAMASGILLFLTKEWYVPFYSYLIPEGYKLFIYCLFFFAGCGVGRNQLQLPQLVKHYWAYGAFSALTAVFFMHLFLSDYHSEYARFAACMAYMLGGWSMILFILGFAKRFGNKPNAFWRYNAEASYWMYLVQIPTVFYFNAAFDIPGLSIYSQYALSCLATYLFCILTYHWFIRNTRLSRFVGVDSRVLSVAQKDALTQA